MQLRKWLNTSAIVTQGVREPRQLPREIRVKLQPNLNLHLPVPNTLG